jgi:hypothetical protein
VPEDNRLRRDFVDDVVAANSARQLARNHPPAA